MLPNRLSIPYCMLPLAQETTELTSYCVQITRDYNFNVHYLKKILVRICLFFLMIFFVIRFIILLALKKSILLKDIVSPIMTRKADKPTLKILKNPFIKPSPNRVFLGLRGKKKKRKKKVLFRLKSQKSLSFTEQKI